MNTESPKTKKSGRGGKRKGAGRKSTSRTTKLMRVPENWTLDKKSLLAYILR